MQPYKSPSLPPNSSPAVAWGSPALRPSMSFPPSVDRTPSPSHVRPGNFVTPPRAPGSSPMGPQGPRSFGPGIRSGSPQFGNRFRTPQPQYSCSTGAAQQRFWSDNRGNRRFQQFSQSPGGSPCNSPNMNPGGSQDIRQYYNTEMTIDPWLNTQRKTVDFWKNQS